MRNDSQWDPFYGYLLNEESFDFCDELFHIYQLAAETQLLLLVLIIVLHVEHQEE